MPFWQKITIYFYHNIKQIIFVPLEGKCVVFFHIKTDGTYCYQ